MKANKAPEKIYVALNELTEDGHTSVLDHRVDYPICTEYIRADAFIEKARKYFIKELPNFRSFMESGTTFIKNFESFIRGE